MVKTKDELLNILKERIGEDTSDEAIAFIEDITDTITDFEKRAEGDGVDWKKKYEDNDAEWRAKYKERFFSGEPAKPDKMPEEPEGAEEPEKLTYDNLFKTEEK